MIIVFGSLNADLVYRLPVLPKPGETVLTAHFDVFPGGKGANQAVAAVQSGSTVSLFGSVGADNFGEFLKNSSQNKGVCVEGVTITQMPTGSAAIYVDSGTGENMIVVSQGANLDASERTITDDLLSEDTTVICQMEVPHPQNWLLIKRAHERGARTLLNVAPAYEVPSEILDILDILVVNEHEATVVSGLLESPQKIAKHLAKTHDLLAIITLGSDGVVAASPQEEWSIPAVSIAAVDTTGAGDTFVGAFAAQLDQGASVKTALEKAVIASSETCLRVGAQG